jgi:hypothetical protein
MLRAGNVAALTTTSTAATTVIMLVGVFEADPQATTAALELAPKAVPVDIAFYSLGISFGYGP